MSATLRFAIIGCGRIANRHAEEISKVGSLVAVCDIVIERANKLAATYNASPFYAIDSLLQSTENIDVVVICTPNGLHAEHSIKALHNGNHVLCEKPMALNVHDCKKMIEAAERNNKKLFVVKSTRYNPALIALKELVEQGQFGQLYSFQLNCFWNRSAAYYANSWKGSKDLDGGTLFTQFSHYIDALLWIFGDIKEAKGYRSNLAHQGIIEFEDSGAVTLCMNSGAIGGINWSLNAFEKNMEVSLTILAQNGSIRIGGEYMNTIEYQHTSTDIIDVADKGLANNYGFYKGSMSNHDKVYANLCIALKNQTHPFPNPIDGLNTVAAIETIYKCSAFL